MFDYYFYRFKAANLDNLYINSQQIIEKLKQYKNNIMSFKGINYGKLNMGSEELQLLSMNNDKLFGISFDNMKNVAVNKNDIIIQTAVQQVGNDDCMCEIRFYVDQPKEDESMQQEQKQEQNQQKEKQTYTQTLYKSIIQKAKIGQFAGDSIATLIDVNLAVPRGKYTIDFYKKNFRLHGASYSYNLDYKHINKGFILPMTNQAQVSIVLQLHKDRPLYQGQTVYRYIVIQVKRDLQVQIKTKLNPQTSQQYPYLKELKSDYNGYLFQIFVDLIQTCSQINIIHPGNNFKSKDGQPCVKCNVKAQPGWLYMLKQSLIFIIKPVIYFKTDQIRNVQFSRTSASNKQFDMKIILKDDKKGVQFMGIQRPQLEALVQYFKQRNVKIDMEADQVTGAKKIPTQALVGGQDDDQSDDEDFDAGEDDDDDQSDSSQDQEFSGEPEDSEKDKGKNKNKQKKGEQNQN